jgi:hypothetical protein
MGTYSEGITSHNINGQIIQASTIIGELVAEGNLSDDVVEIVNRSGYIIDNLAEAIASCDNNLVAIRREGPDKGGHWLIINQGVEKEFSE